jgi:aspartate carbamoyltransferase catalytic subunit
MGLTSKDLLGLKDISKEEISTILTTAESFKEVLGREIKKVPSLRGKTVVNLFYEPSTRTRTSFELAAKMLSADVVNIATQTSAVQKGECLKDTILTLTALGADYIVIRTGMCGAPHFISTFFAGHVLNAGDGINEHPTQALLDMYTLKEKLGTIEGLRVLILGDILHSRVARSNMFGLVKMGAKVGVCGPPTLIPKEVEKLGVKVHPNLDKALPEYDVVNVLRIQLERQKQGLFPSTHEFYEHFGMTSERLEKNMHLTILHPGPMNRGVEISPDVAESGNAVIETQVTNGVAVRMAVLYLLLNVGGKANA